MQVLGDLIELFDQRAGEQYTLFLNPNSALPSSLRPTQKEPSRPRLMMIEEIDSDYNPIDSSEN